MSPKGLLYGILLGAIALTISACDETPTFQTTLKLLDQSGNERTQFSPREPAVFEVSIKNLTDEPQTLALGSSQLYDFVVAAGTPIWHWSFNKAFAAAVTHLDFAAGETKTYQETWDQVDDSGSAVDAGRYVAQGFVWTQQEASAPDEITDATEMRSAPVSFSIQ